MGRAACRKEASLTWTEGSRLRLTIGTARNNKVPLPYGTEMRRRYSTLSVCEGSTRAARRAGT